MIWSLRDLVTSPEILTKVNDTVVVAKHMFLESGFVGLGIVTWRAGAVPIMFIEFAVS